MIYRVRADFSPFFSMWRNEQQIERSFEHRWAWVAFLKAWWWAQRHCWAHPYGAAFIDKKET